MESRNSLAVNHFHCWPGFNCGQRTKSPKVIQHGQKYIYIFLESKDMLMSKCQNSSVIRELLRNNSIKKIRDFPGGPVAKTLHSQYRGPGFDLWSGN